MSQTAPPVLVTAGADRRWQIGCRVGAVWVALGVTAWWVMLWHQDAVGLAPRAMLPLASWLAAPRLWPLTTSSLWELRWDGSDWTFGQPDAPLDPAAVRVAIDLDRWLLLRIDTARGRQWLALSHSGHRPTWHGLRCALYCARPTAAARSEPTHGAP